MLLDWCPGVTLTAALRKQPWRVRSLGEAFGRAQAAIHRIEQPPSTGWVEWAGPNETELKARLRALPLQSRLIHLDYHPLNVMTDGKEITGVLDWTNARDGDPRADFARTFSILRVEVINPGIQPPHITAMRWALERAWRRGYESLAGRLPDMALFYAWAGAAMLQDWEPRVGKPGFWIEQRHLDRVRRWRDGWKRRAGLPI
jgi:aminoglycoside phosphotransferase (APT) family kinase protein